MSSACAEFSNTKVKIRNTKGRICTLPLLSYPTQKIRQETQPEGDVLSLWCIIQHKKIRKETQTEGDDISRCWVIQHKWWDKKQKKEGDVISLCWIIQDQSVEGDTLPAKSHLACH